MRGSLLTVRLGLVHHGSLHAQACARAWLLIVGIGLVDNRSLHVQVCVRVVLQRTRIARVCVRVGLVRLQECHCRGRIARAGLVHNWRLVDNRSLHAHVCARRWCISWFPNHCWTMEFTLGLTLDLKVIVYLGKFFGSWRACREWRVEVPLAREVNLNGLLVSSLHRFVLQGQILQRNIYQIHTNITPQQRCFFKELFMRTKYASVIR